MNKSAKRRLVVVGGIVVIAMLVIVAIAGSGGSASSLSIADVLGGNYDGKKVQVSGAVVADSLTSEGSAAVFKIAPEGVDAADSEQALTVQYDGALPATFGAGVVAICTGTVDGDQVPVQVRERRGLVDRQGTA
jgi:cytochrome c-type biogenesis protein CcmE